MLIENNGVYECGYLDIVCILKNVNTNRYHVAFFEEHPLSGEIKPMKEIKYTGLVSKMHHTGGADTLELALKDLDTLLTKIKVPIENVFKEPLNWDGRIPISYVLPLSNGRLTQK